ncbi:hypothetical protein L226DRAFT_573409 [Lentinus tigrinus ALCF2SS1-7]|uniref:Uncharacterized protein n=1 Tax=Lentinus tigrinus ALCF2SS1-6 TaxID=1328759 RepID=A0A5C2S1V6_9APHY|nr:hypothetical protein L227DRAFT_613694 [Lentinus tigrinus ALCF2SS1-6]RPD72041.1 hypothetical protein L226DRAFT_573409 [Lentinus tigrinus ALCF2SS1-7]
MESGTPPSTLIEALRSASLLYIQLASQFSSGTPVTRSQYLDAAATVKALADETYAIFATLIQSASVPEGGDVGRLEGRQAHVEGHSTEERQEEVHKRDESDAAAPPKSSAPEVIDSSLWEEVQLELPTHLSEPRLMLQPPIDIPHRSPRTEPGEREIVPTSQSPSEAELTAAWAARLAANHAALAMQLSHLRDFDQMDYRRDALEPSPPKLSAPWSTSAPGPPDPDLEEFDAEDEWSPSTCSDDGSPSTDTSVASRTPSPVRRFFAMFTRSPSQHYDPHHLSSQQ